jgi:RimJ/RimL family protein N-acetyltransferase
MSDAVETAAAMTAEIHQWMMSWPFPMSVSDAETRIARCREAVSSGEAMHFVARGRSSEEFVGWVSVWRSGRARWRIGIWLCEPKQDRGLGTEAAGATIRWTENLIRPDGIDAAVSLDNARSIAMLKHLGMTEVGSEQIYIPGVQGYRPHLIMEKRLRKGAVVAADRASAA